MKEAEVVVVVVAEPGHSIPAISISRMPVPVKSNLYLLNNLSQVIDLSGESWILKTQHRRQ